MIHKLFSFIFFPILGRQDGKSGLQLILSLSLDHLYSKKNSLDSSGGSKGKESACNAGDPGSVPGLGRSPGEGNGYPFQYSYLENSMDRGAWQALVHGVAKRWA